MKLFVIFSLMIGQLLGQEIGHYNAQSEASFSQYKVYKATKYGLDGSQQLRPEVKGNLIKIEASGQGRVDFKHVQLFFANAASDILIELEQYVLFIDSEEAKSIYYRLEDSYQIVQFDLWVNLFDQAQYNVEIYNIPGGAKDFDSEFKY